MLEFHIEKFNPALHNGLVGEITNILHEAYAPLARDGMRYWASYQTPSETLHRLQLGEAYLAFYDSKLAGTISLVGPKKENRCEWYKKRGVFTFHQFGVLPRLQGRGVGKRLLDFVETRALELGARELALDTSEHAAHLINAYEKRGYRFVDYVQWNSTNYRSVVMSKPYRSTPMELPEASDLFQRIMDRYSGFWCVAGGWAIDLYLNRKTREHEDFEVVVLREDWPAMDRHFRAFGARKIFSGKPPKFVPWNGQAIEPEVIQLRLEPLETPAGFVDFDLLLTPSEDSQWICRRDENTRLPLQKVRGISKEGIPFLAPEIVLLFKAKRVEDKDEHDFLNVFPSLEPEARRWLRGKLEELYPGHSWLTQL